LDINKEVLPVGQDFFTLYKGKGVPARFKKIKPEVIKEEVVNKFSHELQC